MNITNIQSNGRTRVWLRCIFSLVSLPYDSCSVTINKLILMTWLSVACAVTCVRMCVLLINSNEWRSEWFLPKINVITAMPSIDSIRICEWLGLRQFDEIIQLEILVYLRGILCTNMWRPPFPRDDTHAKMISGYFSCVERRIPESNVDVQIRKCYW